ncbi:MAG TPA: hypothetical protein VJ873_02805 [bacterium]|nr:hypothetical protein [bacterium]
METILDKFARRMVDWLWAPPPDMPLLDVQYTEWVKPEGVPVKQKRWKKASKGRGSKGAVPKSPREFFHRGSYERREARVRGPRKAILRFRGKGSKVERRSRKRMKNG